MMDKEIKIFLDKFKEFYKLDGTYALELAFKMNEAALNEQGAKNRKEITRKNTEFLKFLNDANKTQRETLKQLDVIKRQLGLSEVAQPKPDSLLNEKLSGRICLICLKPLSKSPNNGITHRRCDEKTDINFNY